MRRIHAMNAMFMAAVVLPLTTAAAQQGGHQMAGMGQPASQAAVIECAQAQPQATRTIEAANVRLEAARQANSPTQMRAAVDDLQDALRQLRAQLTPCAALQSAAGADAGHAMPGPAQQPKPGTPMMQPGSTAPAPGAPMDHSKMPMGGAPTGKPDAAPGAKPPMPGAVDPQAGHMMPKTQENAAGRPGSATGAKPTAPEAPMDHSKMPMGGAPAAKSGAGPGAKPAAPKTPMDHSKMPMGGQAQPGKVMDPVNGLMVEPATAPKTNYQGQTYYFSSEQTRKEFLENPAKFAKKPKG